MVGAELVNLPWASVLFLAAGYAGYYIANTGARDHHKPTDIAFSTAVFGFFGLFAYQLLTRNGFDILSSSLGTFAVSCVVGGFWRKAGRTVLQRIFRMLRLSFADDNQSAWLTLGSATNINATQLTVHLKNGVILQCADLSAFTSQPNGPCVLGGNGDVLMFVTDVKELGGNSISNASLEHAGWGMEITYIPAGEIARVELRRHVIF